jgi:hypothetical protein
MVAVMQRLSNTPRSPRDRAITRKHSLVGAWTEEENRFHTSTVVFRIRVREGCFCVDGVDESDGCRLKIFGVTWDGRVLNFLTFFAPTKHKAHHVFEPVGPGKAGVTVSYSDQYGKTHNHRNVDEKSGMI